MALMIQRAYEYKVTEPIEDTKEMKFEDIDKLDTETQDAIADIHDLGIIEGHDAKTFGPLEDTTRQQSAKVIDLYLQAVR